MTRFQRFGWIMFGVSGAFFLVLGIRERDYLAIGGAAAWLIGCIAFLADGRE